MRRPWKTWLAFAACTALLTVAVGWVSLTALELEASQNEATAQAELEERVRLALWRLDSALGALLLQEGTRPPGSGPLPPAPSPSPGDAAPAQARFRIDAAGHLSLQEASPRPATGSPTGNGDALARLLAGSAHLRPAPIDRMRETARKGILPPTEPAVQPDLAAVAIPAPLDPPERSQQWRNDLEQRARQSVNLQAQNAFQNSLRNALPTPASPPVVGSPQPLWIGDALFLVREARLPGGAVLEGAWLDWPALRTHLLATIADLLPEASLEPVPDFPPAPVSDARRLVAIPARLVPPEARPHPIPLGTPVRLSLALAWAAFLAATVAVALLLRAALALAERRTAFVSAVTHELRSPLTTFRLYSEMLAEGMIRDDTTRQSYLDTLCSESARLIHLVENVLAYAGLERGSARRHWETVALGDLVDRVLPRLEQRARQAGLQLAVVPGPEADPCLVRADVSAVEQILFNLVDNACKYAAPSCPDGTLHLETRTDDRRAHLRLRDEGPGIDPAAARRLFRPFTKSAQQAAQSAPGIGLGLALARGLGRSLGGDLHFEPGRGPGATFVLSLPRADDLAPARSGSSPAAPGPS